MGEQRQMESYLKLELDKLQSNFSLETNRNDDLTNRLTKCEKQIIQCQDGIEKKSEECK